MKKHLGLVLAAGVAFASLAAAQVPAPPPPPPAPPAVAAPVVPPAPAARPAPAAIAPAPAPPATAAQMAAPQAPPRPPAAPKPPRPAEAPPAPPPPPPEPSQPPMPGRERGEPDPVNIQFQVTVTAQSGTAAPSKRTATLTVSNGTGIAFRSGLLRAGNNIPVATTSLLTRGEDGKETPAAKPLTSYNYRSVGLNVDVEQAVIVTGNKVRVSLNVEFSGVDEKMGPGAGGPPSFPTFSQRMSLYLESGKPVLVAQSGEPATGASQTVEVKATIMR